MQNLVCEDIRAVLVTPRLSRGFEDFATWRGDWKLFFNGFTIGKKYRVVRSEGNGVIVRNDNGHDRFVTLDLGRSPHIKAVRDNPRGLRNWPYLIEHMAGYFEVEVEQ